MRFPAQQLLLVRTHISRSQLQPPQRVSAFSCAPQFWVDGRWPAQTIGAWAAQSALIRPLPRAPPPSPRLQLQLRPPQDSASEGNVTITMAAGRKHARTGFVLVVLNVRTQVRQQQLPQRQRPWPLRPQQQPPQRQQQLPLQRLLPQPQRLRPQPQQQRLPQRQQQQPPLQPPLPQQQRPRRPLQPQRQQRQQLHLLRLPQPQHYLQKRIGR
mmetsp:Transcript_109683/g.210946  ORF Transcript_109683/g.210946 Transcript_109683/m.210946 type:complete len:212 (-) Transcript_109683:672-1307(-)